MFLSRGGHGSRGPCAPPPAAFPTPLPRGRSVHRLRGSLGCGAPAGPTRSPREPSEGRKRPLSRRVRKSARGWRRSAAQTWAHSPEREERRLRGRGSGGCRFRAEPGSSFLSAPPPPHRLATGHRSGATGFFPIPPPPADQRPQRPPGAGRGRGGYARRERPSP
ncbi:atherin-like [Pongo pygmaeus]|uniref:atherin-like n=1 Tax=Pongo pygmaeus TaxID=9600 RepID=UPI0023E0D5AF|nr:atherin-like [Pongo pygmaeus]XP_054356038.1 atherin-like [Pongo pygmaeus]